MRRIASHPAVLIIAAGLVLGGGDRSASAQNALGEGRSLDSNLRYGSGGYNQMIGSAAGRALDNNLNTLSNGFNGPGRNFGAEVAFRNAIVTGNVGGGREFRGSVGYTAADDFRGVLGSNANFQFERDSFYSGLATRNLVGIDAIRNPLVYTVAGQTQNVFGGPLIINRAGVGASASTALPANTNLRTDVFGNIAGTLRAPSVAITRVDRMPEMLAYTNTNSDNGVQDIMSASPLMGIRSLRSDNPAFIPADPGNNELMRLGEIQPGPGETITDGAEPIGEEFVRSPYQIVIDSLRGEAQAQPYGAVPLGSPVSTPGVTPPAKDDSKPDGPALSTTIPTPDTETDESAAPQNPLLPKFDTDLERLREMLREGATGSEDKDALTDEVSSQAEEELQNQQLSRDTKDDEDKPAKTAPELAAELLKGKSALIVELAVPPSEGAIYAQHMKRGKELLAAERWFDAEERFTAALAIKPGDPIAAAARINSQIAAGMFRSASVNLRNLYRAYPEMMVTRFDLKIIGPTKRTDRVKAQLREYAAGETQFARETALLLAYIGYQTQDAGTIADAFAMLDAVIAARSGQQDNLEETVRELWLNSPSTTTPAPTPAPAPAP